MQAIERLSALCSRAAATRSVSACLPRVVSIGDVQRRFYVVPAEHHHHGANKCLFAIDSPGFRMLVLNREKALNALNLEMVSAMHSLLIESESSRSISGVCVVAVGSKAFCAGGDIRALYSSGLERKQKEAKGEQVDENELTKSFFANEYRLNHYISTLRKPFISFLDGITMGGGCGISVHGAYRVATEHTVMAMPETAIGFFPDVGGGYFLSHLRVGVECPSSETNLALGKFLALSGHRLKGEDLYAANIANHFSSSANVVHIIDQLKSCASAGHLTHKTTQQILLENSSKTLQHRSPHFSLSPYLDLITTVFSSTCTIESIFSSLSSIVSSHSKDEKTKIFAENLLKNLKKMSPTSLKITLEQINRGKNMNLAGNLIDEFRLTQKFMRGKDFYEGVDAMLVRKDNQPKWQPANIEDVTKEMIDQYFKPLESPDQELNL